MAKGFAVDKLCEAFLFRIHDHDPVYRLALVFQPLHQLQKSLLGMVGGNYHINFHILSLFVNACIAGNLLAALLYLIGRDIICSVK